jgi:hypothetical protein
MTNEALGMLDAISKLTSIASKRFDKATPFNTLALSPLRVTRITETSFCAHPSKSFGAQKCST